MSAFTYTYGLYTREFSSNFSKIATSETYTFPIHITKQAELIPGIPDGILALIAPVAAYWVYASIFHLVDIFELAEKYRIHPSEEEELRNKVSLPEVIKEVVIQHILQTAFGVIMYYFDPVPTTGHEMYEMWRIKKNVPVWVPNYMIYFGYMYGWSVMKLCLAMALIDSWQYWLHRIMHLNKTLYRRFHARHHRLYVPYAYGALYNDPIEGLLLDTAGTGLASLLLGLSARENVILFTFATLKTVDDHCGYRFPFDPFQVIFLNNSVYHDIHHQQWGIKSNFSQPFFTFWDKFNNTQYKFVNEFKEMQQRTTLQKYKEFLERKKNIKSRSKDTKDQ